MSRGCLLALLVSCGTTPEVVTQSTTDEDPGPQTYSGWTSPPPPLFDDEAQPVEACVAGLPEGYATYGTDWYGTLDRFVVTVTESGQGERPEGCDRIVWTASSGSGDWQWTRGLDSQGQTWTFGWRWPGARSGPGKGDSVSVQIDVNRFNYAPREGTLDLRWKESWLQAVMNTGLSLPFEPPVALAAGEEVGRGRGQCDEWGFYDLIVDGTVAPYGEQAEVGGATVWHGGVELTITNRYDGTCGLDPFYGDVRYAMQSSP